MKLFTLALGVTISASSLASLVGVLGTDVRIFNPGNVVPNVVQSNFVNCFTEKTGVYLTSPLLLDHVNTNTVAAVGDLVPGVIPKGNNIDSHFIHFDPVQNLTREGVATFDQKIVGVIISNPLFNGTHGPLGHPAVTYGVSSGAYGLELGSDKFTISGDRLNIRFSLTASNPGDRIRVITASAVPEPGTLVALMAGLGLVISRRRKA